MLPDYFGALCDLVNELADLEERLPQSAVRLYLHMLVHRFDTLIDSLADLILLEVEAPANQYEGPHCP